MEKKTVALIFGGYTSEYPVSLKSAHNVLKHMNYDKYDVICIGITDDGKWYRYYGDIDKIFNDEWRKDESEIVPCVLLPDRHAGGFLEFKDGKNVLTKVDVLFPMIHGATGEDGCLQGLFELAGIPYVGCGLLASGICMDKDIAHRVARTVGIKTTKSVIGYAGEPVEVIKERAKDMKYPLFIKPSCAGSSYGVSEVEDESQFAAAVELGGRLLRIGHRQEPDRRGSGRDRFRVRFPEYPPAGQPGKGLGEFQPPDAGEFPAGIPGEDQADRHRNVPGIRVQRVRESGHVRNAGHGDLSERSEHHAGIHDLQQIPPDDAGRRHGNRRIIGIHDRRCIDGPEMIPPVYRWKGERYICQSS